MTKDLEKSQESQIPEVVEPKQLATVRGRIIELESILGDVATPGKIKQWILDICQAEDIRKTATGEEYRTPAWETRVKGIDRVMRILKYVDNEAKVQINQPSKIVIQVIDNQQINSTPSKP